MLQYCEETEGSGICCRQSVELQRVAGKAVGQQRLLWAAEKSAESSSRSRGQWNCFAVLVEQRELLQAAESAEEGSEQCCVGPTRD